MGLQQTIEGATSVEDRSNRALHELVNCVDRLAEHAPNVNRVLFAYSDRLVNAVDQMKDLIHEAADGLVAMPLYRGWAHAILEFCRGGGVDALPAHVRASLEHDGEPMHVKAVRELVDAYAIARQRIDKDYAIVFSAVEFVLELQKKDGGVAALYRWVDEAFGVGSQTFHALHGLRAAVAARELEQSSHE